MKRVLTARPALALVAFLMMAAAVVLPLAGSLKHSRSAPISSPIKYLWVVMMENTSWSVVKGNPSMPYVNNTLLPQFAHAENYITKTPHADAPA